MMLSTMGVLSLIDDQHHDVTESAVCQLLDEQRDVLGLELVRSLPDVGLAAAVPHASPYLTELLLAYAVLGFLLATAEYRSAWKELVMQVEAARRKHSNDAAQGGAQ